MRAHRTDKQEDRVEVGYQQLAEASSIAEVSIMCFFPSSCLAYDPLGFVRDIKSTQSEKVVRLC